MSFLSHSILMILTVSQAGDPTPGPRIQHKASIAPTKLAQIEEFLVQHDRLVSRGKVQKLREMYAPDFFCTDLENACREEMLRLWEALLDQHRDVTFATKIARVDQLGDYFMVSGCRPFQGRHVTTHESIHDDLCESIVLRQVAPDRLEIQNLFEIDHDKFGRFLDESSVYRAESLGFEFEYLTDYLLVPHRNSGASIDQVLLMDPAQGGWLKLKLMEPSLSFDMVSLLHAEAKESAEDSFEWLEKPRQGTTEGGFEFAYAECSIGVGEETYCRGSMYLTADHQTLFSLTLRAPLQAWQKCRQDLQILANTLRLLRPGDESTHRDAILRRNPRWNTVQNGVYRHPVAPLSMVVPESVKAVPLLGDGVQRVRFELKDDPHTAALLTVYDPGWGPESQEQLVAWAEARVRNLVCRPSDQPLKDDRSKTEVLGDKQPAVTFDVECGETGSLMRHRAVSFAVEGYRGILQMIPRSPHGDVQDQVWDELRSALRHL